MDIKKNNVSAENQTIYSSDLSFLGSKSAPLKILIVGNSITRHGPKQDIGWPYDWGMAASAPENDYVHKLYSMFKESGREVYMMIRQAACWEMHYREPDILSHFKDQHDFEADIVIYRLGENVPDEAKPTFKKNLIRFIEYICPNDSKVLFTTCFWENSIIDDAILELAKSRGEVCVDIHQTDDSLMALGLFEHSGVAMHPGDKGMQMIAEKIYNAI